MCIISVKKNVIIKITSTKFCFVKFHTYLRGTQHIQRKPKQNISWSFHKTKQKPVTWLKFIRQTNLSIFCQLNLILRFLRFR